jgi:hypothetical protein
MEAIFFPSPWPKAAPDWAGGQEAKAWRTAGLVSFTQGEQADSDGDNANADKKDDDWGHGKKD